MSRTIHSDNSYLTNNTIVFAGFLALTPFGAFGLPDLIVKRYSQAKWHLALCGIAIAVAAILSASSVIFLINGFKNAQEVIPTLAGTIGCIIVFGSWFWSMWEGAWMLGHIETVRAQASQRKK